MKILLTGAGGQLGSALLEEMIVRGIDYHGADMQDFDITDKSAVFSYLHSCYPDAVIHCAAYTAVDKAEDEPSLCMRVNQEGTENIALACKQIGATMMYISTDYVFDGKGEDYYMPHGLPEPTTVYGKSKFAGEQAVLETLEQAFIVRISWVFGANGNNFVNTMLRLGKEQNCLNVVCDQIGSPTYTSDLAPLLCDMIVTEKYGIYHATNEGVCSWAEFAQEIFHQADLNVEVNPIPSSEYLTKATRPPNSRLSKQCLDIAGFSRLPHWKDALARYLLTLSN